MHLADPPCHISALLARDIATLTRCAELQIRDTSFVMECRGEQVTPHVAQNVTTTRGSRIDGRTTRHPGYAASLRVRKRIEEGFG